MPSRMARRLRLALRGEILGGLPGAEGLQPHAHLDDLDRFVDADGSHACTPVGEALHESLAGEVQQGVAHRRPGRLEAFAEVCFDEPLMRRELGAQNRVADALGEVRRAGAPSRTSVSVIRSTSPSTSTGHAGVLTQEDQPHTVRAYSESTIADEIAADSVANRRGGNR